MPASVRRPYLAPFRWRASPFQAMMVARIECGPTVFPHPPSLMSSFCGFRDPRVFRLRPYLAGWAAILCLTIPARSPAASFLFDATHAETAGNADWVIDADSNPQRFPTPDQSTVTASTPETYWRGGISAWGISLVKLGHHVETLPSGVAITYLNASNVQDLSHYQVFVVDEPNKIFTTAEKSAIVNWVRAGGSLFMVADHGGSDRNGDGKDSVDIWNDLFASNGVQAAPFGIVFKGDKISPNNESADSSASNPITHGPAGTITHFVYSDGSSLTIDPTKNSSVKGAVWTTSSHTSSNVMVAYGTFGAGKFVAIGDSSPIDDGTGASSDTLFNGWSGDSVDDGHLVMNASIWLATALTNAPPANDNFASAASITGSSATASGTNVNATKEAGEPNHGGDAGGKSVWWNWTAPSSGNVVIDTNGSGFDTLLGVYTGSAVGALTTIAGDNNSGSNGLTSKVSFAATAGVVYRIAVDGTGGASGSITLNLALSAPGTGGTSVTIASWDFEAAITTTTPYPRIPASAGSGYINFTGWGGTIDSFGGVTHGGVIGKALALIGTAGNGTYIEIDFSMAGYRALNVTFATRGTSTGYTSGLWSWSANGGPFTTLPGVNTATTSTTWSTNIMVDFSGQTGLNNASSVRLRYTLSGASGSSPNNRIDDLVVSAILTPIVSVVVNNGDAYEQGTQPATVTVSSSLAAPTGGLPVSFQLSGTATAPGLSGADYSLSGNSSSSAITIPAGGTSAVLTLTPLVDNDPTEFDETATVTLQAGTGYFVGAPNATTVTIHDDTPYNSTWTSQFPTFHGALAAPTLDMDGDGIPNLLEFAFNGDPFHVNLEILPTIGEMNFADPADGNTVKPYPIIAFDRRTDAPNLIYAVEISTDLVNWTNDVEEISAVPDVMPNMEEVVYRGLTPLSGNGAVTPVFLRVRVTSE